MPKEEATIVELQIKIKKLKRINMIQTIFIVFAIIISIYNSPAG
jgi:hypothetical protein